MFSLAVLYPSFTLLTKQTTLFIQQTHFHAYLNFLGPLRHSIDLLLSVFVRRRALCFISETNRNVLNKVVL